MLYVSTELEALEHKATDISAVLKALGNERRLSILCRLAVNGEMPVGALMTEIGLGQSALSQHLARLRAEEIVGTRRDGQAIWYYIADERIGHLLRALYGIYCG